MNINVKPDNVLFFILLALFIISQILLMVTWDKHDKLKTKIAVDEKVQHIIETKGETK